jgi:uncharacterized protein with NRDE domain
MSAKLRRRLLLMCLIVLAQRCSDRFPLILAANRDEDYERPTDPADFWKDEPAVVGGRDRLQGGTWLAITTGGRFAAVTNLRGAARTAGKRSRGDLVRDFVTRRPTPRQFAGEVALRVHEYAGFHLLSGEVSGEIVLLSGTPRTLEPGVHGLSNAPDGEKWEKVDTAVAAMHALLSIDDAGHLADELLRLIGPPAKHGDVTRDLFIAGERYGTRSSTVIVAERDRFLFVEQSYGRGGTVVKGRRAFDVRAERRVTATPAESGASLS